VKVTILCRRLTGKPTDGFERYSHDLVEGLRSKGVEPILPNQDALWKVSPSGSLISPLYYDLLHPLGQLLRGKMNAEVVHAVTDAQAILFPWVRGAKVLTMHHVDKTPADSARERAFRAFYSIGTRMGLKYADRVICVSTQTKREVKEAYGVEGSRLVVVPHAISEKFRPLPGVVKEETIGYVGALKRRKNLEFLIRAFHQYTVRNPSSHLKLVLCGEGTERASLIALASELGVGPRVEFRDRVPEEDLVRTYNSFSMVAMTSFQEGFGFPILEAQACGVPVLTVEGALIPPEVAEATVRCRDQEDMADRMHTLLMDQGERDRIVQAGLEHAALFTIEKMAEETLSAYREAISDRSPTPGSVRPR
jgi:glycosyltransferase involved in cell wall biosynthesis